jgi:hypothetical protein
MQEETQTSENTRDEDEKPKFVALDTGDSFKLIPSRNIYRQHWSVLLSAFFCCDTKQDRKIWKCFGAIVAICLVVILIGYGESFVIPSSWFKELLLLQFILLVICLCFCGCGCDQMKAKKEQLEATDNV